MDRTGTSRAGQRTAGSAAGCLPARAVAAASTGCLLLAAAGASAPTTNTPTANPPNHNNPAGTLIVYAKTEPEAGAKGITAFIVEKGMKVGGTACSTAACSWAMPSEEQQM